jgi:subtilisin family serine protease
VSNPAARDSGRRRRGTRVLAVVLVALALCTLWSRPESDEHATAMAAEQVATRTAGGPPAPPKVVRAAPLGDSGIQRFKVVDDQGDIAGVDVDAAGNPVSAEAVERAMQDLASRGFVGKLESELAGRVARGDDTSPINTVYWLSGAVAEPLRGDTVTPEKYEARLAGIRAQIAALQKPVADQLRASGQRILYQAQYAPVVVAASTGYRIRAMEARADVERVYLERTHRPRLNVSRVVVQANLVNGRGFTGVGERVAIVEVGRIASHPNLPAARRLLCRPGASGAVSDHKTGVAGVIQSTNASRRGMAPGITLVDAIGADFSDAQMMAATDCAISQGATAINMSFGSETNGVFDAFARFVDSTVYRTGRTIVVAVSNECANRMGSPEIAFNAVAVGAFGDRNTTMFGDDGAPCSATVPFSAFRDPTSPHGDREEPDLVAPGDEITTTTLGGQFETISGTSFAAPHVTGGVGLLKDRLPALHTQAERVRAILMAAARHNLEGASRLSERDGAGGLMLAAADRVLIQNGSFFFTRPGGATGFPINQTFMATAGETVRVALAWAHKTGAGTQPTTDLDLTVRRPGGASVGSSVSFDNSYEIVQFVAPVTGTYSARITNRRPSVGMEHIGLAVSRSNS